MQVYVYRIVDRYGNVLEGAATEAESPVETWQLKRFPDEEYCGETRFKNIQTFCKMIGATVEIVTVEVDVLQKLAKVI